MGSSPDELKLKFAAASLHQNLLVYGGVLGIFPINKPLWIFVVVFLYNKTDYREWFLSGLYWELCM